MRSSILLLVLGCLACSGGGSGEPEGSGGSAGAGGSSGSVGVGGDGGCVDVSHTDERQIDDLRVLGTGFDADDGHTIRVVATHREPTYGVGEAVIEAGAFDIFLPSTLGDYTGLGIWIDRIRDDACNPDGELLWQMTTGVAMGDWTWEVTPDTLSTFEQAGPCNINGIFDLTVALPCPTAD